MKGQRLGLKHPTESPQISQYISDVEIYEADQSLSDPKIIPRVERETVGSDDKLMRIIAKIKSDSENSSKFSMKTVNRWWFIMEVPLILQFLNIASVIVMAQQMAENFILLLT